MSNRALVIYRRTFAANSQVFSRGELLYRGFQRRRRFHRLLHALSQIRPQLDAPVSAVHVNHGIHPDADHWQQQCEHFCQQYGIELTCLRIELNNRSGKGLEAEARHLRYEAIAALLKPADCLLTAHHADDQAETLLLNLMRGSGVDGLSGMPESRPLGIGFLQRPLLRFKNSALRDYLRQNNIDMDRRSIQPALESRP